MIGIVAMLKACWYNKPLILPNRVKGSEKIDRWLWSFCSFCLHNVFSFWKQIFVVKPMDWTVSFQGTYCTNISPNYPDHWLPLAASSSPLNSSLFPTLPPMSAFSVAFDILLVIFGIHLCITAVAVIFVLWTLLHCSITLSCAKRSLDIILKLHSAPLVLTRF